MKLIVILILLPFYGLTQDTIEIHTVSKDVGVISYIIQDSSSTQWSNYITIQPKKLIDSNVYVYILPKGKYFRVLSNMLNYSTFISSTFILPNDLNSIDLTNTSISKGLFKDNLSFTVVASNNIDRYIIQKSTDKKGTRWTTISTITSTGLNQYTVDISGSIFRFFGSLTYRVIPVFKDNVEANPYIFK